MQLIFPRFSMTPSRYPDGRNEIPDDDGASPAAGFVLFSVAPAENAPASSMQWLYQRMYEEALKASQPKPMATRDLFAVMN
jgi:hypothetical protein